MILKITFSPAFLAASSPIKVPAELMVFPFIAIMTSLVFNPEISAGDLEQLELYIHHFLILYLMILFY